MRPLRAARWALETGLAVLLLLAGCASPPQGMATPPASAVSSAAEELASRFMALRAGAEGRLFRFDAVQSTVRIHVFRAGRAAALGHNHVLSAPSFEAWLWWPDAQAEAQGELRLRLSELLLDDPAQRAAVGGSFAPPLSEAAIAATRANMLGERGLDAGRFPELRLRLIELAGDAPKRLARIEVGLHGATHALDLPLRIEPAVAVPDGLRVSGSFVLRHRDLGLQPFSIGAGLLAVQDALLIEFSLLGRPQ